MSDNQLQVDTSNAGQQQHLRNASAHSDAANTLTSPMGKDGMEGAENGEFKYPERLDQYEFRGSLYKKRGGWGKHLGWRLRAFTLYQGYLCYYEAEQLHEDVDRLKPRGVLNLGNPEEHGYTGSGVSLYVGTHKAHDHAPTEWVFQLASTHDNQGKWKLCACNKQEYDDWINALTRYVGPALNPRSSSMAAMDFHSRNSLERDADDPTSPLPRSRLHSTASDGTAPHPSHHPHHRNASHVPHHHLPHSQAAHAAQLLLGATTSGLGSQSPPSPMSDKPDWDEIGVLLVFTTLCAYYGRVLSWRGFCIVVLLLNLVLLNALVRKKGGGLGGRKRKKGGLQKAASLHGALLGGHGEEEEEEEEPEAPKVPSKLPPIGSTVEAHTSLDKPPPDHSWNNGRAENFKVRMGPNYKSTGRKEFSGPAMYRLLHLDIYKTPCKISHIGALLEKLPEVCVGLDLPSSVSAPRLFIVNCQLPSEAPSLLSSADDGPGYNVVFYLGMTEEMAEQLKHLSTAPPALRLLDEYFRVAPERPDFRGRFKAMAQVWNMKELGLPSAIEKFNGKPVLITKSGTLLRTQHYCEMDINVHKFGFAAKRGLHYLQERFKEIVFEVGFTIEGREDAELPEVMLGVGQFNRIDVTRASELAY